MTLPSGDLDVSFSSFRPKEVGEMEEMSTTQPWWVGEGRDRDRFFTTASESPLFAMNLSIQSVRAGRGTTVSVQPHPCSNGEHQGQRQEAGCPLEAVVL